MTISRRQFAQLIGALAAPAMPIIGRAQSPLAGKVMVGYPAGGSIDVTARRVADAWRKRGANYYVDNRPGAAGRIATSQLKREKNDGSVVLVTHTSALTIYPHVYTKSMYNPESDLAPISTIGAACCGFAVSSMVPASVKNMSDYVAWVKQSPGNAQYASAAAGSLSHFLCIRLAESRGLQMQHIAYRGSVPAMQDLLGGQIPAYMGFLADFIPHRENNKIRVLAVTSDQRAKSLPEVATFLEQGFDAVKGVETYGLFAPPGTPEATTRVLSGYVRDACNDGSLAAGLEQIGVDPMYLSAPEYQRLIRREFEAWGPIVKRSGFKIED